VRVFKSRVALEAELEWAGRTPWTGEVSNGTQERTRASDEEVVELRTALLKK